MSNDNDNNKDFTQNSTDRPAGDVPPEQKRPSEASGGVPEPTEFMPKKRKNWIWMLALGIIVAVAATNLVFSLFWSGGAITDAHVNDNRWPESAISGIVTDISTVRTYVHTHNSDDIRVSFDAPNIGRYTRPRFEVTNGILRIYTPRLSSINFFGIYSGGTLNIYLPANMSALNQFELRTTTGRIIVDAPLFLAGDVRLNSTTGRIQASNFSADSINIDVTTGRVELENLDTNRLFARTTTGRIEGDRVNVSGNLELNTSTGRIELSHTNAEAVSLGTTTGRINIEDLRAARVTANTTTGRIETNRMNVGGDVSLTTTTGRVEVTGGQIDGWLTARTTTGRIDLERVDVGNRTNLSSNTGRIRTSH